MSYVRGADRSQVQLLPPSLDEYVAEEAPVRFIDAYVEGLDFVELGFQRSQPAETGRPGYHPGVLVKLYIYGYLNRIRSSRRLEAEALRNMEVIWLLGGLHPDFKTIADFRKDNRAAFKLLFKQFNLLCRKMNLFGAELVAIDGCKFKAVNNTRRHYTQEQLREIISKIETRIDQYLDELDAKDEECEGTGARPDKKELAEKIARIRERKGQYEELLGELVENKQKEVSLTDADSRRMKRSNQGHIMGYNVQVAVDAKHDLIVAQEVVQAANDRNELEGVAKAAKENLAVDKLQVVADKGYHEAEQLQACEQSGIEAFVPAQGTTSGQGKDGQRIFPVEKFVYDPALDVYRCPADQTLQCRTRWKRRGRTNFLYDNRSACASCPLKAQCTTGAYRQLTRRPPELEAVVNKAAARVAAAPQILARRKEIVEHVFGTMRNWGHDEFLMRGLEKVRAEFSLSALAYNLRRVLNLRSLSDLLAAMQRQAA